MWLFLRMAWLLSQVYGKFVAEDGLVPAAKILATRDSNAELCLVDEAVMDRRYGVLALVAVLRLKLRTGKK